MKKILFILFIGLSFVATAQERVTFSDPDLKFSYVLPHDWCYKDDPLYHYISNADCDGEQIPPISLTYFNYDCPDIEVCLDGKVNGEFKSAMTDFELKDNGVDTVDGTEARWAIFTHTVEDVTVKEMIYVFVRFGQLFEARYRILVDSFDKYHAETRRLLRSFQVKPNS